MIVTLQTERIRTIEQIAAFVAANEPVQFQPLDRDGACAFVARTLTRLGSRAPDKPSKALVKRLLAKTTGYFRAQLTRLIRQHRETARVVDRRDGNQGRWRERDRGQPAGNAPRQSEPPRLAKHPPTLPRPENGEDDAWIARPEIELLEELAGLRAMRSFHLDDSVATSPVTRYTCPKRFARERQALFRTLPALAAHSSELTGRDAFLTRDLAGLPLLLTRDGDGAVHAFLNSLSASRLPADRRGQRLPVPVHLSLPCLDL